MNVAYKWPRETNLADQFSLCKLLQLSDFIIYFRKVTQELYAKKAYIYENTKLTLGPLKKR